NYLAASTMYERFTDRSRKVMRLANDAAQRFNCDHIDTEHLLWALAREEDGVAANILKNLGVDARAIRIEIEKLAEVGLDEPEAGTLPESERLKKVVDFSFEECRSLNHNYVGTEHLLLGLLRDQDGVASQVLANLGLKPDE